jgi:23S rRNA G2445 N2-methylase RlmL
MSCMNAQISTVMGLEALVKQELETLGYPDAVAKNGRVEFQGDETAIAR